MASLREHRHSRFLYACITGPDGKQKQFSTGLTDKREAMAVAVTAEEAFRKHSANPQSLRKALERLAGEYSPTVDTDPAKWLAQWAKDRAREVSDRTAAKYAQTIREASEWLTGAGVTTFGKMTPARMTELRNHWAQANGAATVTLKMKILRGALTAAVKAKLLADNPAEDVAPLRKEETRRREFRPEELEILVPKLTGEWKGMFFLGLYTGQRLNDLAELRWRNVDMTECTIALRAAKTGATVALPLADPARKVLLELPGRADPASPMFPGLFGMSRGARSNAFRKLLWSVGLARHPHEAGSATGSPNASSELCFHSLRHTATSMLKAAGVSDSIARAIVGHESAAVSRVYTHLDMPTMRAAMNKMPAV